MNSTSPTSYFITGAAGCVGRALIKRLGSEQARVVAMDIAPWSEEIQAVSWIQADILEPESYFNGLSGIDTVVHLAAKVHSVPRTLEEASEFIKINLEGTKILIDAAQKNGVRRFIFVSTVAVLSFPRGTLSDAYADSKRQAERLVLTYCDRMEVVVIRPSTVYGPEDKGNVYKLIRWIDKGLPPLIGSGTNRKSMVYVHTLADALVFLSLLGKSGMAYVVTDGRDVTMREIVENICKSLGRRNRWPVFPCPAAKAVSRINEYLSGRIGLPLFLGRDMLERLVEETVFDPDPLFSLGFTPRYTFEEGIAETVQWYKRSIC